MKEALKYGLLALGGWWILRQYFNSEAPAIQPGAPAPGQQQNQPQTPLVTPPLQPPAPPMDPQQEHILIMNAAGRDDVAASVGNRFLLTADQWNWYESQFDNTLTTEDLFTPGNRGELINAQTYRERRKAAGLSGLRFWRA